MPFYKNAAKAAKARGATAYEVTPPSRLKAELELVVAAAPVPVGVLLLETVLLDVVPFTFLILPSIPIVTGD